MSVDVKEIAGRLMSDHNRNQRYAVIQAGANWKPACLLHREHSGAKGRAAALATGLFESRMGGAQTLNYRLTPLGLAVRNHLLATEPTA